MWSRPIVVARFTRQHAYQKFKREQSRLNVLWQQWRLEIQALGKAQQERFSS